MLKSIPMIVVATAIGITDNGFRYEEMRSADGKIRYYLREDGRVVNPDGSTAGYMRGTKIVDPSGKTKGYVGEGFKKQN